MTPVALTIAGSDPSGGAGLQADLKTFHQFGVYGEAVVTLLTVQNTVRVSEIVAMDAGLVGRQLDAVSEDIPPRAAKTGALGTVEIVEAVAAWARRVRVPLVVDPVMVSKHGAALLPEDAERALLKELAPLARILTPNIPEAERLSGIPVPGRAAMREAARRIADLGAGAVLLKGGHLGATESAYDLLLEGGEFFELEAPRIASRQTHGTGCVTSAAITAGLAEGLDLVDAAQAAKRFVQAAIRSAPGLGAGQGPLNLHASRLVDGEE